MSRIRGKKLWMQILREKKLNVLASKSFLRLYENLVERMDKKRLLYMQDFHLVHHLTLLLYSTHHTLPFIRHLWLSQSSKDWGLADRAWVRTGWALPILLSGGTNSNKFFRFVIIIFMGKEFSVIFVPFKAQLNNCKGLNSKILFVIPIIK